jgi:hypothetical protein
VKTSLLASTALSATLDAQPAAPVPPPTSEAGFPTGKIAGQEFSRLMLGGNLISGWSHARDLRYVSTLMRRYNTEAKIRETLELAEAHGITAINTYVMDDNTHIWNHWKRGGKMKWFVQVRLDAQDGYSQIDKAIGEGATGVHLNGDAAEALMKRGQFGRIAEMVQLIKAQKVIAGVGAHDLRVIVECVKAGVEVDFYQKTLHSHDYYTAPRADETEAMGNHDNSWCKEPQAVVDFMANVQKPWIAFKILAAGALMPQAAFPYAVSSGADFILVGMFDWQIADNVKLARRIFNQYASGNSKRTRPWHG